MDPVVLAKALESGSLSRTKPEHENEKRDSKLQSISLIAADNPLHPYAGTTTKALEPKSSAEKDEGRDEWSTDPRDPHSNPPVFIGERYKTNDYGICTVSELRPGRVYMKTPKGKVVIFRYPYAFVNKKVMKV